MAQARPAAAPAAPHPAPVPIVPAAPVAAPAHKAKDEGGRMKAESDPAHPSAFILPPSDGGVWIEHEVESPPDQSGVTHWFTVRTHRP